MEVECGGGLGRSVLTGGLILSMQWRQRTPVLDLIATNVAAWIEGSKLAQEVPGRAAACWRNRVS